MLHHTCKNPTGKGKPQTLSTDTHTIFTSVVGGILGHGKSRTEDLLNLDKCKTPKIYSDEFSKH